MGTSIEFDRLAVAFDSTNAFGDPEQHYVLVNQIGSDNVLDHDDNIARRWNFYTIGDEADVIREVALAAGDIESGMIRYQNGPTKTENYIKNWRKELTGDAPMSLDEFTDQFHLADLVITHPETVTGLPDPVRESFKTVKDEWRRTQPENRDQPVYRADITLEALRLFETLSEETHVRIDFKA